MRGSGLLRFPPHPACRALARHDMPDISGNVRGEAIWDMTSLAVCR
jgi:hypothetical protein